MKTDLSITNKIRRYLVLLVLFCMSVFLCACGGKKKVTVKNTDGTKTRINYENHGILTRAPVFTAGDKKVTMQFNGTEWFIATVIEDVELEPIAKQTLLAKSKNICVYENPEDEWYGYIYVLDLQGTDASYIAIYSMDAPDHHGYGTDFDYFISYTVDGVETVPDMEWELVE